MFPLNQSDLTKMGLESRLRFMNTEIWEFMGVVVGMHPLLRDWILLCELWGWKLGGDQSNDTTTI